MWSKSWYAPCADGTGIAVTHSPLVHYAFLSGNNYAEPDFAFIQIHIKMENLLNAGCRSIVCHTSNKTRLAKKKLVFYYGIFIYSRLFATAIIIELECILIHLLFIQPSRVGIAQFVCAFFFYSLPLCFSLLCAFWPLSQCERPKLIHFPHSYHCAIMHYVGLCVFLRPEREGSARGLVVSSLPPIAAMHSQSHQRWATVLLFGRWIGT